MLKDIIASAIQPAPGVIAVISSAGSGKTYTLTNIYLSLLLKGIPVESILTLTFTNKAVEELRNRILLALVDIAFNSDNALFFSKLLTDDPEILTDRAKVLIEEILFDYSKFSVQTIDSFLNRLRFTFGLELGISPYAQPRSSVAEDLDLIIAMLLLQAESDRRLTKSVKKFVEYFSQGLAVYNSWDPIDYAQKIFVSYLNRELRYAQRITLSPVRPLYPLVSRVIKLRDEFLREVFKADFVFTEKAREAIESLTVSALESVKDFKSRFFLRKSWEGFIKLFKKASIKNKDFQLKYCYEKWLRLLKAISELDLAFSQNMPSSFLHIYKEFREVVSNFQRSNDLAYLDLITDQIADLDPSLVAEKVVMRYGNYKYILIDEFQDTSLSQWESLCPIIEEMLSQGGGLVCVGDPKQTIYRWRGSFPDIFSLLKKRFSSANYKEFVLSENWRSAKEIVEFNNQLFSEKKKALPLGEDLIIDAKILDKLFYVFSSERVCQQVKRKDLTGKVTILSLNVEFLEAEEIENQIINELISLIRGSKASCPEEQIAVLVRRRSEAQRIISALFEEGIAVVSNESVSLVSSQIIRALFSLLRWMAYPEQKLYLYMFLLSDLWAKFIGKDIRFWEQELRFLSYDKIIELIRPGLNVRRNSLYFMIKDLIKNFKLYELFPQEKIYFDGLLEMVLEWEMENTSLLSHFLDYWKKQEDSLVEGEKLNLPSDKDAVKVMTIHTAKGLEFDTVILPFLQVSFWRRFSKGLADQLFWESDDKYLQAFYINKTLASRTERLAQLYGQEMAYQLWDNLNLLYVAFTRAKKQLIIFLPEPSGKNNATWQTWIKQSLNLTG